MNTASFASALPLNRNKKERAEGWAKGEVEG